MPLRSRTTGDRNVARSQTRITLWDRVLMHDIGLANMFSGGRALLCLPAGMASGYAVGLLFHMPALIGIMLGALPAFLTCFAVVDKSAGRVAARSAALYVPFVVALFASIALREFRIVELVLIVALLFIQFYTPRFGPWAADFGAGLFGAYLCGLLLPLPLTSFPAIALIFAASLAATIVVRAIVFHPNSYRSLMRTGRAFLAWQTRILETAADVLDGDRRAVAALPKRRQLSHEAALTTDGLLGSNGDSSRGAVAEQLHTLVFDGEHIVDGLARLAEELHTREAPAELRLAISKAIRVVITRGGKYAETAARNLLAWAGANPDVVADAHSRYAIDRAALLLSDLGRTGGRWSELRHGLPTTGENIPFQSPVVLANGRPVGAAPILTEELATNGMSGPWRRLRVSPALRTAIQAAVAVAIAEPVSFLLDGQRFYWGVIGVMVVLAGTNSTHDRLRKVANRGIGTVIGGAVGIVLVGLLGVHHPWWTLTVVLIALVGGMYGFMHSYMFWVIGLVVALCQVYAYSGQFSDTLILFRLIENLVGALIAVGVSMVILPIATGAMIRRATLRQLAAIRKFVTDAKNLGYGSDGVASLRGAARALDHATFQLEAVFKPMVRFQAGGGYRKDDETRIALVGIARTVRSIASYGERNQPLPPNIAEQTNRILTRIGDSIAELAATVGGATGRTWISSTALISNLDFALPDTEDAVLLSYRLHALAHIDEALTTLAARHGMTIDPGEPTDAAARPSLAERWAQISAGTVRRRFPVT